MIYAVATSDNKLAHHFSKAQKFAFYNQQKEMIALYKNPALGGSGCSGKGLIIALLRKMNCDVVIVRKIGQKTLGKLLAAGFKVEQGNTRSDINELIDDAQAQKNSLTRAEQGVVKKASSCCGAH